MLVKYGALRKGDPGVAGAMSAARSARNLQSRRRREEAEESKDESARRRRKTISDREAAAALLHKVRVRVPQKSRPKRKGTPRKLTNRSAAKLPQGGFGVSSSRGPDGFHSIHFDFTARSFTSRGRRWKTREAERSALYILREEGLETPSSWISNISADRNEISSFFRTVELLERHDRKNATVYVSEVIALPAELTTPGRLEAVNAICRTLQQRDIMFVAALHKPDPSGDQRNFHVHVMYSTRPATRHDAYDWSFCASKDLSINCPNGIRARRDHVVQCLNEQLARDHVDKRYTALSHRARHIAGPVQPKVGQARTWAARRMAGIEMQCERLSNLLEKTQHARQFLVSANARLRTVSQLIRRKIATTQLDMLSMEHVPAELDLVKASLATSLARRTAYADALAGQHRRELDQVAQAIRDQLVAISPAKSEQQLSEHAAGIRSQICSRALAALNAESRLSSQMANVGRELEQDLLARRDDPAPALRKDDLRAGMQARLAEAALNVEMTLVTTREILRRTAEAIAVQIRGSERSLGEIQAEIDDTRQEIESTLRRRAIEIDAAISSKSARMALDTASIQTPPRRQESHARELNGPAPTKDQSSEQAETAPASVPPLPAFDHQAEISRIERENLDNQALLKKQKVNAVSASALPDEHTEAPSEAFAPTSAEPTNLNSSADRSLPSQATIVAGPAPAANRTSNDQRRMENTHVSEYDHYDELDRYYEYEGWDNQFAGSLNSPNLCRLQAQLLVGGSASPESNLPISQGRDLRGGDERRGVREVREGRGLTLAQQVANLGIGDLRAGKGDDTDGSSSRTPRPAVRSAAKGPLSNDGPIIDPRNHGRGR